VTISRQSPRLPGLAVDPDAIRRARLATGLSLAQVAGDELSRAAIHRVEQGKVRPSLRTLQLIADRTGQPVERFLLPEAREQLESSRDTRGELVRARVERLIVRGQVQEALEQIEQRLAAGGSERESAHLSYLAGRCHQRASRPLAALSSLRRARAMFEQLGDERMVIECMAFEAAALGVEENPAALETAHEALRRCHALEPVAREIEVQILNTLGGIHLSKHDWTRAMAAYESAVEASGQVRDLERMAQIYDGMSLAMQGVGNLQGAVRAAERALALTGVRQNQLSLARAENNLGHLLMRMDRWDEAEEHLQRSLRLCEEARITVGKCHVVLSIGHLRFLQRDYRAAAAAMLEAAELAEANGERMTLALAKQWLGRVCARMELHRDADRCFLSAISILSDPAAGSRLAECHSLYAQVLDDRGDVQAAIEHWRAASKIWQPALGHEESEKADLSEWADGLSEAN
jgi:HTH-type transcriptional regulator, quorum sensing regulator NprR